MSLKKFVKKHFFSPPIVKNCSQTLYQSLSGCINFYKITKNVYWLNNVAEVTERLLSIQQSDGGYDIGYDFNFGYEHNKGESTSPELYGVTVLNLSYDVLVKFNRFDDLTSRIRSSIIKSVAWIENHSREKDVNSAEWVIPYGPYSTKKVMVYNGVSFAAGALGPSIRFFTGEKKEHLLNIYNGFCLYLLNSLSKIDGESCWYYNDQERTDLSDSKRNKIDFYHQAQQLEVHSIAQEYEPNLYQREIINNTWQVLCKMSIGRNGKVPYTNSDYYFRGHFHLWGLASVASGLAVCLKFIDSKEKIKIEEAANKVCNFIMSNAWTGSYFHAILDKQGCPLSEYPFMPRSDAWVVASLSKVAELFPENNEKLLKAAISSYEKIKTFNFSGPENHSVDFKKKLIVKMYKIKNGH